MQQSEKQSTNCLHAVKDGDEHHYQAQQPTALENAMADLFTYINIGNPTYASEYFDDIFLHAVNGQAFIANGK